MTVLYHGSHYNNWDLKPSIVRTKELVKFKDDTSNEWLHASIDREAAIIAGFVAAVAATFKLHFFRQDGNRLEFIFQGDAPSRDRLRVLKVYLYTIYRSSVDGWEPHGKSDFRTQKTVDKNIISQEGVDLIGWCRNYDVRIRSVPKVIYANTNNKETKDDARRNHRSVSDPTECTTA